MTNLEDTAPEPIQDRLQPIADGKFRFDCHPSVPCFTECCRCLNLLLTPYDVVRLKNRLGMPSGEFLERHGEIRFDEQRRLPMVNLRMQNDDRKTCPFVAASGCQVYEDRPAACRIYPVARASRKHRLHGTVLENFFLLREDHCRGFEEEKEWTIEAWTADQGLERYHEMNNLWMEVITHPRLQQGSPPTSKQQQMFLLASYNIDKFREFVLGTRFLQIFVLSEQEENALREDDEALLRLAFRWLKFSLVGEPALTMREQPAGQPG